MGVKSFPRKKERKKNVSGRRNKAKEIKRGTERELHYLFKIFPGGKICLLGSRVCYHKKYSTKGKSMPLQVYLVGKIECLKSLAWFQSTFDSGNFKTKNIKKRHVWKSASRITNFFSYSLTNTRNEKQLPSQNQGKQGN